MYSHDLLYFWKLMGWYPSLFSCKCTLINKDWDVIGILNSGGSYILVGKVGDFGIRFDLVWIRYGVQGVESLWGDCRFIPADLGS